MAFNPSYVENIAQTMGNANPGKGSGRRKRHAFKLKARNKRNKDDLPQFIPRTQLPKKYRSTTFTEILDPNRRENLDHHPVMKATTARGNDGMSFVW